MQNSKTEIKTRRSLQDLHSKLTGKVPAIRYNASVTFPLGDPTQTSKIKQTQERGKSIGILSCFDLERPRYEDAEFRITTVLPRGDCPKCGFRRSRLVSERIGWRYRVILVRRCCSKCKHIFIGERAYGKLVW